MADVDVALEALRSATLPRTTARPARGDALKAQNDADDAAQKARVEKAWARTPTSMPRAMAEIKAGAPNDVVVVDETITANLDLFKTFTFAGPGDYYGGRGGGIGQGVAGALGVADRPTRSARSCASRAMARQCTRSRRYGRRRITELPIVFVILCNREYRVLKHNIDVYRQRFGIAAQRALRAHGPRRPTWGSSLANGMGVEGTRV